MDTEKTTGFNYDLSEINTWDLDRCRRELSRCAKNPKINLSLVKHPELLKFANDWANTICWLEDRISDLQQREILALANAQRWANQKQQDKELEYDED